VFVANAVPDVTTAQRFHRPSDFLRTIDAGDDDGERLRELAGLIFARSAKERAQRRIEVEQSVVEHHRRRFENRLNRLKAALDECDLVACHDSLHVKMLAGDPSRVRAPRRLKAGALH
jgi:hypothetical protein